MNKKICFLGLFLLIIICINTSSFATFQITDFTIDTVLNEKGDLYVTERIIYYTDEIVNGLTRKIITKNPSNKINSADSLQLNNIKVDGENCYQVNYAEKGQDGVYEYTISRNNEYNIKLYSPFDTYYKTVEYEYVLYNVAVKYNDIGEIFWNFIGDEWDCNINNLTINIELPEEVTYETSWVFGHGSNYGSFTKNENNITLTANNIEAYQPIDARILFARNAIDNSSKIVNKDVLEQYINEEQGMFSEIEQKKIIVNYPVKDIAIVLTIIVIILGVICYILFDKEVKVEKNKYIREIPFGLPPELLQYIYYGKMKSKSFYIAVLNLVKLGVYKIENTVNEVGKETQKLIYNSHHNAKLKEYQKHIVNTINGFLVEENGEFGLDFIKLSSKMERTTGSGFRKYKDSLKKEKESLFGKPTKIPKKIIWIAVICMACIIGIIILITLAKGDLENAIGLIFLIIFITVIYSILFVTAGNTIPVLIFLILHCGCFQGALIALFIECNIKFLYIPYILMFVLIQYLFRIRKFPKEERQIIEQIKGLRRYIKDYSLLKDKDSLDYIELWEDYFIMAIALGLNTKTINYFYNFGKEQNTNLGYSMNNTNSYMNFHHDMYNSFYNYQRTSNVISRSSGSRSSSYSSSSGGFSGGSSSGGRGGRWWRRRTFLKLKGFCS